MLCLLWVPVKGLPIHPSSWRSTAEYQLPQLLHGLPSWTSLVLSPALRQCVLRVGSTPYIVLWFRSFWPTPVKLHLLHSNLSCFFQTRHMPGCVLFALLFSLLEIPSPSSTWQSLLCFVTCVGHLRCAVFSQSYFPEPRAQASAHSPSSRLALKSPIYLSLSGH